MDASRTVLSASKAEAFFREGENAVSPDSHQHESQPDGFADTCAAHGYANCVWCARGPGIDLPGVGHVHAAGDPELLPSCIQRGSDPAPGEVPEPLRGFLADLPEFNKKLCQLLPFAARDVAEYMLQYNSALRAVVCQECFQVRDRADDEVHHAIGCRTGRLAELLDELQKLARFSPDLAVHPNHGKEELARAQVNADGQANQSARSEFAEPWKEEHRGGMFVLTDRSGDEIYYGVGQDRLILKRIAACVNFCAGVETAKLEQSQPLAHLRFTADCPSIKALFAGKGGVQ
jgi:hypothetical protein